MMKLWSIVAISCLGFVPLLNGNSTLGKSSLRSNTVVESEASSLAKGFERAFSAFPRGVAFIVVRSLEGSETFGNIRRLQAFDGVVFVELDSGVSHVFSSRDVLRLTTEGPKRNSK